MSEVAATPRPIKNAKTRARVAVVLGAVSFVAVGAIAWNALQSVNVTLAENAAERATEKALQLAAAQAPPAPKEVIKVVYVPRPTPAPRAESEPVAAPEPDPLIEPEPLVEADPEILPDAEPAVLRTCVDDLRTFTAGRTILFNIGSAEVDPGKLQQLRLLGEMAAACDDAVIRVTGHSDSSGSDLINLGLSWERADNTIAALEAFGFSTEAFEPLGFGARSPIAQGDDADDELNRRVEFQVYKKSEQDN